MLHDRPITPPRRSVALVLVSEIGARGVESAVALFPKLRADSTQYLLSEEDMNSRGYDYLGRGRIEEARALFTLNVEAYPDSWNVYDSLGESYAAAGENELAIKNCERSIQLNPENTNGIETAKRLKGQ